MSLSTDRVDSERDPYSISKNVQGLWGYIVVWLLIAGLCEMLLYLNGLPLVTAIVLGGAFSVPMGVLGWAVRYVCRVVSLRKSMTVLVPMHMGIGVLTSGVTTGFFVVLGRVVFDVEDRVIHSNGIFLFVTGLVGYSFSVAYHYLVETLVKHKEARREVERQRILARDARLHAIRSQLDPHFLFNSLNSISALISVSPQRAREMVLLLSDFFRQVISKGDAQAIPLEEEIAFIKGYLEIERVRFEDRMSVRQDVAAEALSATVPPLLLQPLVENAVKHGVSACLGAVEVSIRVTVDAGSVTVQIGNGVEPHPPVGMVSGRGLALVNERLIGFFGDSARLMVKHRDNRFDVTVRFPYIVCRNKETSREKNAGTHSR